MSTDTPKKNHYWSIYLVVFILLSTMAVLRYYSLHSTVYDMGLSINNFLFIEDVDLCQAIKKKGLRVVYFPNAKIFHKISSSNTRSTSRVIIKRHQGMIYYNQKYSKTNLIIQYMINSIIMARCLLQILLNIIK